MPNRYLERMGRPQYTSLKRYIDIRYLRFIL